MEVFGHWDAIKGFWRGRIALYRGDVGRLYGASRPMAVSVVFLGVLSGLVPIGVLVGLFRLTDALVGSRAVRVATNDLHNALWTALALWLLVCITALGRELLQGVAGRIANATAKIVLPASLLACTFLFLPFGTLFFIIVLCVAEAFPERHSVRMSSAIIAFVIGVMGMATLVHVILSRDVTVGGFLLFTGALFSYVTWFVLREVKQHSALSVPNVEI